MTMTVTLPDHLSERLAQEAEARQMHVDSLVAELVSQALQQAEASDDDGELAQLTSRIKATPVTAASIHAASASLHELLASAP